MRRRTKQIGLIIGVMMMTAMAGTGTVFAAAEPARAEQKATAPGNESTGKKKDKKQKNEPKNSSQKTGTESQEKQEKSNSGYYGKIIEIGRDKLVLEGAEIISEENNNKTEEKSAADFENGTTKWKLNGKNIEIKLDSKTEFLKEMIAPKTEKKAADKKQDSAKTDNDTKSKGIPLKKIREGSLVRVTLRADDSGVASEIMMLSGVKEIKAEKKGV